MTSTSMLWGQKYRMPYSGAEISWAILPFPMCPHPLPQCTDFPVQISAGSRASLGIKSQRILSLPASAQSCSQSSVCYRVSVTQLFLRLQHTWSPFRSLKAAPPMAPSMGKRLAHCWRCGDAMQGSIAPPTRDLCLQGSFTCPQGRLKGKTNNSLKSG